MTDEKPVVVQEWLDGKLSTNDAIWLAVVSDDPAARVWGYHMFGMQVMKPQNAIVISVV